MTWKACGIVSGTKVEKDFSIGFCKEVGSIDYCSIRETSRTVKASERICVDTFLGVPNERGAKLVLNAAAFASGFSKVSSISNISIYRIPSFMELLGQLSYEKVMP